MVIYFFIKRENKYEAILKIRKWSICFVICIMISAIYTNIKNKEYDKNNIIMTGSKNYIGTIISNPIAKEYYTKYTLKLNKVGDKDVNIKVYLHLKNKMQLEYGDEVCFEGEYKEPDAARNDKGFN